ncbi:MarR family winged helix-turn-helix transcriptional regulator [Spongisporangium articulatum]|uniref:MarR family winged helix-turn-helix transcriptional regulator n=1 Tax=Spongisporangium articulatum TaxID=3362603 RepID=A0ABW8AQS6_9ACTN
MPAETASRPGGPDEVDAIVDAWRRELPDLDASPLEVLSRVSRLARHLDRTRAATFAAHGLELWEFDVLAALRRAGTPYRLSPGRLVALTLVTSGTMTNRLDRLEARALLRRLPDPDDGRGVIVELAGAGRELVDAAIADLVAVERDLLSGLSAPERSSLSSLLRDLLARF